MLAVITGTIKPARNMNQLILRDEQERLKQYQESIEQILKSGAFRKVVFCENSNYGIKELEYLLVIAKEQGIELELLSFQGNEEEACKHGKGYGEGESIKHIIKNSQLVQTEDYLIKITGRLKVDNIQAIAKQINTKKTYFNIPNRTRRDIYDTRLYGMPLEQFKTFFLEAYSEVQDDKGVFLETVYTKVIRDSQISISNFPRYPRISGISGSGDIPYQYTEWKCKIKDILSRVNFYKIKKSNIDGLASKIRHF